MAKTLYVMKLGLEVEVDPTKHKSIAEAGEWFENVAAGKVITPPEGMKLKVEVISAPNIVKRQDK